MRQNYFKSIGLVLLGIVLSTIIFSFTAKENIENEESNSFPVPLKTAQQDIAAYQMWQKYLPDYISIDKEKDSIHYKSKEILSEDRTALYSYITEFLKQNDAYSFDSLPFSATLNTSYYIDTETIKEAYESYKNETGKIASGINLYLGVRGLHDLKLDKMESHLYVVPTNKIIIEKDTVLSDKMLEFDGGKFALDLTEPCPNLCAYDSPLHHPTLQPYSGENE